MKGEGQEGGGTGTGRGRDGKGRDRKGEETNTTIQGGYFRASSNYVCITVVCLEDEGEHVGTVLL